ncbi:MAG TPA: cytochrome c3 family protein, partial [Methyloceanibacter sp.]|nr:cytochrome c3 family protein [Methyloceanibacter sp.]
MRRPVRTRSVRPPKAERQAAPGSRRDRLAVLLALVTVVCLGSAFFLSQDTQFLMPGPLASAHGAIENCSACHTKSGSGKLSWIHGLVAGDPLADSKACLTCHKMPDTAFNAHSASAEVLKQSTKRLTKIAAGTPAPQWARTQSIAFPTHDVVARGLYCATCHQEHQGVNFNLSKIANEKCGSCHVVKFDSFDGHHPKFENYPFKRRTRIIYDHAEHFSKHFPEVAKKDPARRLPATCSDCHNSHEDKRVMAVAPFEQTCTACHLDQIIGKERASGPKGIAFLTLPGLDLKILKGKNAPIGEWPDASEAELTPFMKVMISRDEQGRALIKAVDGLNLQDLTDASDEQIKAVTTLVWEIKRLFYALISGKASDVLADLDIGGGKKLSADVVADLTASLPRDVVISAQQQWLPNLATEMNNPRGASDQSQSEWSTAITAAASATEEESGSDAGQAAPTSSPDVEVSETASIAKLDPPVCTVRIFGQCLLSKGREDKAEAAKAKAAEPEGAAGDAPADSEITSEADDGAAGDAQADSETANEADGSKETLSVDEQPGAARPEGVPAETDAANAEADGGEETFSADEKPQEKPADQTDDLLSPTEDELRAIKAAEKAAQPEGAADAPADSDTAAAEPQTGAAPVISIESDVDPESWAEYGGWYRQDYAIFYRPTGHKDKFIYSWLFLTGPQAPKGDTSPAAAVFDFLTSKDAQG